MWRTWTMWTGGNKSIRRVVITTKANDSRVGVFDSRVVLSSTSIEEWRSYRVVGESRGEEAIVSLLFWHPSDDSAANGENPVMKRYPKLLWINRETYNTSNLVRTILRTFAFNLLIILFYFYIFVHLLLFSLDSHVVEPTCRLHS